MNPDCCTNCDFKTGFVVLEEICPVCKIGILYGDVHTKGLLCSNGCKSFPFAVPFAGTRNCESYLFADYTFTITDKIKRDLILTAAKEFQCLPSFLYRCILKKEPFFIAQTLSAAKAAQQFLEEQQIPYKATPEIPIISHFSACSKNHDIP